MTEKGERRFLLLEDHGLLAIGLQNTLKKEYPDCEIVHVDNLYDAQFKLNTETFDFAIIDLVIKGGIAPRGINSGDELIKNVKDKCKYTGFVVLSNVDNSSMVKYLFDKLRVDAYVLKGRMSLSELLQAIKSVESGERFVSPSLRIKVSSYSSISIDQIDRVILTLLSQGHSQIAIEKEFSGSSTPITLSAVEKRLASMKHKFNVDSVIELVVLAVRNGLI